MIVIDNQLPKDQQKKSLKHELPHLSLDHLISPLPKDADTECRYIESEAWEAEADRYTNGTQLAFFDSFFDHLRESKQKPGRLDFSSPPGFVEQHEIYPNRQLSSSFFSLLLIAPGVLLWISDICFVVFPSFCSRISCSSSFFVHG